MFSTYLIFSNNYGHPVIICDMYNHLFESLHFSYLTSHFTHLHIHIHIIYLCHILYLSYTHAYICSIHIIYTSIYNLILSYHIMVHFMSFTFFFLFISTCTCHYLHLITYNKLIYMFVLISNLYLFRSPIRVTELIPIQRYLYMYLYFYLSYTCSTELIHVQRYP